MKSLEQKIKKQKGVTMVALVVTIVVLIILAGISIAVFRGDNGIVERAIDSQVETELSQLQETLNKYKARYEKERIGDGDYSGQMDNADLLEEGILKKISVKENDMTLGIIFLDKLGINSNLGNNAKNINVDQVEKLTDLNDVFVIDFKTNDIYYIKDSEYWIRDGEGNFIYNNGTETDYDGPEITVNPSEYDGTGTVDVSITVQKGTNELNNSNVYEYYLSTSNSDFIKGKWIKYTSGESINIGQGLTGEYYLYVKEVEDVNGNKSIGGKKVIIDGKKYHRFGKYKFNNDVSEYRIEYELNGGTVSGNPSSYTNVSDTFTLNNPTKQGYTFIGWTGSNGNIPQKEVRIEKGSTGDRKYIANWQVNGYTVTYDYKTNGGSSTTKSTETVNYGERVDLTPTATKAGYVFVGWNTNKDATKGLSSLTMQTSNVTLYAIFSKTITATFNYYDGETKSTTLSGVAYNNQTSVSITAPSIANVTLDGKTYTARGWSTNGEGNATINLKANETANLSSNTTYYASYTYTVTLSYDVNGGSGAPNSQSGTAYMNYEGTTIGADITISTTKPTRTG